MAERKSKPPIIAGPQMKAQLQAAGIHAQRVTRKRDNGYYVVDFFSPEAQDATQPSEVWAQRIARTINGAVIIDKIDTVATWRPNRPVIWASVTFAIKP